MKMEKCRGRSEISLNSSMVKVYKERAMALIMPGRTPTILRVWASNPLQSTRNEINDFCHCALGSHRKIEGEREREWVRLLEVQLLSTKRSEFDYPLQILLLSSLSLVPVCVSPSTPESKRIVG